MTSYVCLKQGRSFTCISEEGTRQPRRGWGSTRKATEGNQLRNARRPQSSMLNRGPTHFEYCWKLDFFLDIPSASKSSAWTYAPEQKPYNIRGAPKSADATKILYHAPTPARYISGHTLKLVLWLELWSYRRIPGHYSWKLLSLFLRNHGDRPRRQSSSKVPCPDNAC